MQMGRHPVSVHCISGQARTCGQEGDLWCLGTLTLSLKVKDGPGGMLVSLLSPGTLTRKKA